MSDFRSRAVPARIGPKDLMPHGASIREMAEASLALPRGKFINLDEPRESSYLRERYEALQCALTQPCVASHEEPGELVSWANRRGVSVQAMHAKKRSIKAQRELGGRIVDTFARTAKAALGCSLDTLMIEHDFLVIVITRIAPRGLDSDNLEASAKGVRDGIAAGLGIDDRSPAVRYCVSQEQGAPRECRVRAELHIQPKDTR